MSLKSYSSKIFLVSLGCAKNLVDSEHLVGNLGEKGFALTFNPQEADVFLINTCGFIGPARTEGYQTIEEALEWKKKQKGIVAVVGCLAQKETAHLGERYPELDVISGFGGYSKLGTSIRKAQLGTSSRMTPSNSYQVPQASYPKRLTAGASAYLKLGEGCSKRCAFCSIPHIRGDQRSVPLPTLVDRAQALAEEGVKELLLIAQDPVTYGKDLPLNRDVFSVLDALEAIEGIEWIRMHYLFPGPTAHKLIERMAGGGKLLPYIDMPLQHVNSELLRRMNRPALGETSSILERARESIKDVTLRTTFIVGFPGESEETIGELEHFIRTQPFDKVGTFTFSPEPGTKAFELDRQVEPQQMRDWRDRLMAVAGEVSLALNREKIDTQPEIMIDIPNKEKERPAIGRTKGQSLEVDGVTYIDSNRLLKAGDIVRGTITEAGAYDLYATKK